MNRRLLLGIIGAAAIVVVIASCGSSGESLTREQYLKRGEAICARASKQQFAAFKKGLQQSPNRGESPADRKAKTEQLVESVLVPRARKMVDELEALGAPEGNEHVVKEMIDEFRAALHKAEASPKAFLSGKAFASADEAVEAYGLSACRV